MPYEPLHHKYRPQTFAELVGQEAIATTLTNALRQQRIAPAYLFTGARGTGKTSSARILAKSLNCLESENPTETPCGKCEVCRAIANGSALDVIEIDAASNTGVDNIRELIERSQFAPVQCRHKVYVIDECLAGDSLVQTSEGLVRIDNPEIQGKQVLSYNDQTGVWEFKKVLRWFDQGVRPTYLIKTTHQEIRCTGNHLIRTDQGWKPAAELEPGMKILSPLARQASDWQREQTLAASGSQTYSSTRSPQWTTSLEVVESVHLVGAEAVYDIEVEDNHNFVANGLCVHNCHMLSTAAFNALLKTLEEPPDRVVFVLATTDPQRVLPTIISRCQRFDFRRIPLEAMVHHLSAIAHNESINIAPDAVQLVAQIAQGGLRDAESLLDQLSLLEGQVTVERVWDLVGAVPERDLLTLLQAIATNDPSKVLDGARHLMNRGREPLIVLQNLASFYRDLLIAKTAPSRGDLVAITPPTWAQLCEFAQQLPIALILEGQKYLRAAEVQIKNTTQPRLWLEVTLLGLLPSELGVEPPVVNAAAIAPKFVPAPPPISAPPPPTPVPVQAAVGSSNGKTPSLANQLQQLLSQVASKHQLSTPAADLEVLARAIAQALLHDQELRSALGALIAAPQPTVTSISETLETTSSLQAAAITESVVNVASQNGKAEVVETTHVEVDEAIATTETTIVEFSEPSELTEAFDEPVYQSAAAVHEVAESDVSEPEAAPSLNLEELWQRVLGCIELRGTQALLGQQCYLLGLDKQQAKVGVRSQPLIKIAQRSLPVVEEAFHKAVGYPVKVALVVATAAEPAPSTPTSFEGNAQASGAIAPPSPRPAESIPNGRPPAPVASPAPPASERPPANPEPNHFNGASHSTAPSAQAEPTAAVEPSAAIEPPSLQNIPWQEEDEVTRAAKRLAEFFGGKVVDLEAGWSSEGSELVVAPEVSEWDEADSGTEADEVPF